MNKKIVLFLLAICLQGYHLFAQTGNLTSNTQSVTNQSSGVISENAGVPASSIYSPDLFTGTVNVNIPIYDYSVDGVDLGISLSYNTVGIHVDDIASDVGLGWTLNTGGIITRQVNGIEDELTLAEIDTTSITGGPSGTALAVAAQGGALTGFTAAPCLDPSDMFNVVIGNESFKFIVVQYVPFGGSHGAFQVMTIPKKKYIVDIIVDNDPIYDYTNGYVPSNLGLTSSYSTAANSILRFKITDNHGNQFFFDRGDFQLRKYNYTTFHPLAHSPTFEYLVTQSWVLSKVITYTGATISYTYTTDPVSYPGYNDQRVRESSGYTNPFPHSPLPGSMGVINNQIQLNRYIYRPTQITYPNGDIVTFNTSGIRYDISGGATNPAAITSINIQKGYDATVKNSFTYNLNYAYYNSSTSAPSEVSYTSPPSISNPNCNLRLKLKSINKVGTDNVTTENYYTFGYVNTQNLPARLSGLTDCYGYYNGQPLFPAFLIDPGESSSAVSTLTAELNDLSIPFHSFSFTNSAGHTASCSYGRFMSANVAYAQAGLLNSITNGSGGTTNFTYTSHSLSNPPDFNTSPVNTGYYDIVAISDFNASGYYHSDPNLQFQNENDGVCIASISTSDGYNSNNNTNTTFSFSGGIRFFVGGYFWYPDFLSNSPVGAPSDGSITQIESIFQNSFVTPIEYVNGFNHGYSGATVQTVGPAGEIIKTNAYTFTNLEPQPGEIINGIGDVGAAGWGSRIELNYGLFAHTLPCEYFESQWLGLPKSVSELDNLGNVISKTVNTYTEYQSWDSAYAYMGGFGSGALGFIYNTAAVSTLYGAGSYGTYGQNKSYAHSIVLLTNSVTTNNSGASSMTINKNYYYDAFNDVWQTQYTDSKGEVVADYNIYTNASYTIGYNGVLTGSPNYSIIDTVRWLTGSQRILATSTTNNIVAMSELGDSSVSNSFMYDGLGNQISLGGYPTHGIYLQGCPLGSVHFYNVTPFFSNVPVPSSTSPVPLYLAKHFHIYDDHNNVLETGYNNDQNTSSAIWDTRISEKVASVTNAHYSDIAYTSFEGAYTSTSTPDYNKGNWVFNPAHIVLGTTTAAAMTGRYYYDLSTNSSNFFSLNSPVNGEKYIISFWYKGALPHASCFLPVTLTSQITIGAWTLVTGIFTGNGSSHVGIGSPSASCYIDELRMYPVGAAMDTYTYNPLIGVSSHCDERNNITYYQYDAMGRPTIATDITGAIISLTKTVVQGSDH